MAGNVTLIGDALSNYALITRSSRSIGTIIPDVTVEEVHHDEMTITDHPVEVGATISDHAFKRPAEVEMRVGWSNSTGQSEGYVQEVYQNLLELQANREPFQVSTGKRNYNDMLIRGLAVTTDEKSEFALNVVVSLRQIIITSTSGVATSGNSQSNQASPQQTAPVANRGTQQTASISGGSAGEALGGAAT